MNISKIFEEKPEQWGLRGDPPLWSALEMWFLNKETPSTKEEFSNLLERAFKEITGEPLLSQRENVYIEGFNAGGMSGGHVCFEFWRETGFPLLVNRYQKYILSISI